MLPVDAVKTSSKITIPSSSVLRLHFQTVWSVWIFVLRCISVEISSSLQEDAYFSKVPISIIWVKFGLPGGRSTVTLEPSASGSKVSVIEDVCLAGCSF